MNFVIKISATAAILLAAIITGCSHTESGEHGPGKLRESRGEHDGDGREGRGEHGREGRGEHGGEGRSEHGGEGRGEHGREGEESGTQLALHQSYDKVRNGARLVLAYDASSNSFKGTVKNTTDKILKRVRVEVHLSNGKELGPTTPADLAPGKERAVELQATSKGFKGWSAHPEVGSGEHGREGK